MKLPAKGNLNSDKALYERSRGWFIGHFAKEKFFRTDDFEVKWAVHKKGEVKKGLKAKTSAKTIVILLKGSLITHFPELGVSYKLEEFGDYLVYDAGEVKHITEFPEDSVSLVIRWPSRRE